MWSYTEHGELYFDLAVNSLLPQFVQRWEADDTTHSIAVVFFARVTYDDDKPKDYYKVVKMLTEKRDNENMQRKLKTHFLSFLDSLNCANPLEDMEEDTSGAFEFRCERCNILQKSYSAISTSRVESASETPAHDDGHRKSPFLAKDLACEIRPCASTGLLSSVESQFDNNSSSGSCTSDSVSTSSRSSNGSMTSPSKKPSFGGVEGDDRAGIHVTKTDSFGNALPPLIASDVASRDGEGVRCHDKSPIESVRARAHQRQPRANKYRPRHGHISEARDGNFLEAINQALNALEDHYVDRNLSHAGQVTVRAHVVILLLNPIYEGGCSGHHLLIP